MNVTPILSSLDFSRLLPLVGDRNERIPEPVLERLDEKLASAALVRPQEMQPDVVTMNSRILLASGAWPEDREYRLVYPSRGAASPSGELSVFSALGSELLGARPGAFFSIGTGASARVVKLLALTYQPEAAGDFEL